MNKIDTYNLYYYTYNNNMINIPKNWKHFFDDQVTRDIIKTISYVIEKDNKSGHLINPDLNYIWSPFFYTSYKELKVIILGDQPYNNDDKNILTNKKSNFYFYDILDKLKKKYNNDNNNENGNINTSEDKKNIKILSKVARNDNKKNNKKTNNNYIESNYDIFNEKLNSVKLKNSHLYKDKDIDILDYCNQGVMFINNTLTIKNNDKNSHTRLWNSFMNYLLGYISKYKNKIIFILWGENNKKFKKNIDKRKHYIIENTYPNYNNIFYNTNNLQQCNDLLTLQNIPVIKW